MDFNSTAASSVKELLELCVFTDWIAWGLLPYITVNIGFWLSALPLEYVLYCVIESEQQFKGKTGPFPSWSYFFKTIAYRDEREHLLAATRKRITFMEQVRRAALQISGPSAILGASLGSFLFPLVIPLPTETCPSIFQFFIQMVVMELVGDFLLYWGHRIQHTNKFLWENFHYHHHQISTPSPIGTADIDGIDATLQTTLPLFGAALAARAHPISFWCYCCVRVAENTLNHSGLNSTFLDIISLKCLPFRASPSFHDYHHGFNNYPGQAKNYGENFIIWDMIFCTTSKQMEKYQVKKAQDY